MEEEQADEKDEEDVRFGIDLNGLDEVEEDRSLFIDGWHTIFGCAPVLCN